VDARNWLSIMNYIIGYYSSIRPHRHDNGKTQTKFKECTRRPLNSWPNLVGHYKYPDTDECIAMTKYQRILELPFNNKPNKLYRSTKYLCTNKEVKVVTTNINNIFKLTLISILIK